MRRRRLSVAQARAEERADALLRALLTPDQFARMVALDYLEVASRLYPSRIYRVPWRKGQFVWAFEDGKLLMFLCFGPRRPLPRSDVVVLHKVYIEAMEDEYLRIANCFPVIGDWPPDDLLEAIIRLNDLS